MLTITDAAIEYIRKEDNSIYLEMPKLIQNCCFYLQECPSVRFGTPRDPENYEQRALSGIAVFVPHRLPETLPLTIAVNVFFGFRRLVVEGWSFC
ncbi:MAG TPA: CC/Se motif family (seleno)protein [Dissulfurispiraceae bacterium]|nr:CC/Se motif family (seleno)protein [Dissulfurispiraceae bacterium]